ncbi:MAG TPA: threonine--tRNA ligase [Polyangiaceae bacterium]|nr:threonine--tRNA ligase [Polyangiaceae bacterium]
MLAEDDHREIGRRLDLFHFQEEAAGMVFFHPRGFRTLRALEQLIRRHAEADGFAEVRTPQLLRQPIWEASGHWQHFRSNMFVLEQDGFAVKPVSCPGHLEILRRRSPSYRELPLRYSEFGLVHRNEPSGTLHGLFRLRQFTQDDGHVFCELEQVEGEVARFCQSLAALYRALGFERVSVGFASRPDERAGSDAIWDRAEQLLQDAARRAGLEPTHLPKAGAFYGPKLEFSLPDRQGRSWQCGTIQLDLVLPERFDVAYVDAAGQRIRPLMLHRATLGSLERFLGVLLEQHAGRLPPWLAPDQVAVLPVEPAYDGYAREVEAALSRASLRVVRDSRDESLARRVALAHESAVPFALIVGKREAEARRVSLRDAAGQRSLTLEQAPEVLAELCRPPL